MTEQEAEKLKAKGIPVIEDSGRGYRQVVASPAPVSVVEFPTVKALLEAGQIPIAAGGGGIPVALENGQYRGMSAVIDKDSSAAKLAELIDADSLVILTAVEKVCINFGTPEEQQLDALTVDEALAYSVQGQFGKGSMDPKVRAAVGFVRTGEGKEALITKLSSAKAALAGETGTRITR
jgi:carbamate kinase